MFIDKVSFYVAEALEEVLSEIETDTTVTFYDRIKMREGFSAAVYAVEEALAKSDSEFDRDAFTSSIWTDPNAPEDATMGSL